MQGPALALTEINSLSILGMPNIKFHFRSTEASKQLLALFGNSEVTKRTKYLTE